MSPIARLRAVLLILAHLAGHPTQVRDVPDWLRHQQASTMDLRRPWWPRRAATFVAAQLAPGSLIFEYGGGGSTLWLHDHGCDVTVVEHDRAWFEQLVRFVPEARVLWRPPTEAGLLAGHGTAGFFDDYVASITELSDTAFDLVIVDGRARVECIRAARPFVRPGGMLLLDDSDRPRYQPVHTLLADWPSRSFRGLKPGFLVPATTTVWRRPLESVVPTRPTAQ